MIKLGVLGSTSGTDLQAIIDATKNKKLDAEVAVVISNKENAYILERASKQGILSVFINPKGKTREEFDREVDAELEKHGVELVLLIGYMKIISGWFVKKWYGKAMNIHPSLLPAFGGAMDKDVHQAVLDFGCKVTGCTLHFVTEEVDSGPIIAQKCVPISEDETVETLKPKVQAAEQEIILKAINWFADGRIKLDDGRAKILGKS
ncbi:MAG: phosphoribosylglycinamide formyltransferase [Candidatus Diapherotrites archaeon]|nr:phosphoribosylglycinamide formyltransferase [Candidatus Diapherotrites archaeon]